MRLWMCWFNEKAMSPSAGVSLQRRVHPVQGSIVLCGLDPLLRDMVRITHLDRVFDVYGDEEEALRLKAVDGADAVGI
jgi:hypothetical protein